MSKGPIFSDLNDIERLKDICNKREFSWPAQRQMLLQVEKQLIEIDKLKIDNSVQGNIIKSMLQELNLYKLISQKEYTKGQNMKVIINEEEATTEYNLENPNDFTKFLNDITILRGDEVKFEVYKLTPLFPVEEKCE